MWGIITVQMLNLGFPSPGRALHPHGHCGIAGATMRIPPRSLCARRRAQHHLPDHAMLLAPAIGTGIVLQHKDWPLWVVPAHGAVVRRGGGNFASSMSNISTFFPSVCRARSLGLNAGLGNFGVTTMQIVIPLVMTMGMFGLGGAPEIWSKDSGWIFGKIAAGTPTWIQNAGLPGRCRWCPCPSCAGWA